MSYLLRIDRQEHQQPAVHAAAGATNGRVTVARDLRHAVADEFGDALEFTQILSRRGNYIDVSVQHLTNDFACTCPACDAGGLPIMCADAATNNC